jgi:pentatricopeptide repeat protein
MRSEASKSAEEKGDLARLHGNFGAAVAYFRIALRDRQRDATLYNKLGVAELQNGNRNAARKFFKEGLKHDPQNAVVMNNLGVLLCMEKKYEPAVRQLKQALALNETNASAHLNLAEAWAGLGEMDRAMTEYARAVELNADILTSGKDGVQVDLGTPEQRARVDFIIARSYAKRGNTEGALEYLKRAKKDGFPNLEQVYSDKTFAALWEDPQLARIVKRRQY